MTNFLNDIQSVFSEGISVANSAIPNIEPNTYAHQLDNLVLKSQRLHNVSKNKIWDYIHVENDPNFQRLKVLDKFNKLTSNIAVANSILTVVRGQLLMSRISEYFPSNVISMLSTLSALSDSAVNLLDNFDSRIVLSTIEDAFLKDFKINIGNNTITFNDLVQYSSVLIDVYAVKDEIFNNGLREVLSIPIGTLVPDEIVSILESVQWLDELNTIFNDDEANQIQNVLETKLSTYSDIKIDTIVNSNAYTNKPISYSDPYGLNLRTVFIQDLKTEYSTFIDDVFVNDISYSNTDTLKEIIKSDYNNKIDSAFSGNEGLPSLSTTIKGIDVLTYNQTVSAIQNSITRYINDIIETANITAVPENTRPIDYLQNIKKNIKARLEFERVGATRDKFINIDAYLETVTPREINKTTLLELLNSIETLTNENITNV
jgi:hypothetical protein